MPRTTTPAVTSASSPVVFRIGGHTSIPMRSVEPKLVIAAPSRWEVIDGSQVCRLSMPGVTNTPVTVAWLAVGRTRGSR